MTFIPPSWRKFDFFESHLITDPASPNEPHRGIKALDVTCVATGRGQVVFGDSSGLIHIADRSFNLSSFQAYNVRVSHLKQMKLRNILISIGEDDEGINPTIKVWNLDKSDKNKNPQCVRTIKISHENKAYTVSAFVVLENLTQIAVGLVNGAVILYRGDISRDRSTKIKTIHKADYPITGLGFREHGKNVYLFVVTPNTVDVFSTAGREIRETLDNRGCELGLSTMTDTDQDVIVGKNEAVYFYNPDGPGPCFVLEGEKKMVGWFRNYLAIVARDTKSKSLQQQQQQISRKNTLILYDLKNKFAGFLGNFTDVIFLFSEWTSIFVLTGDKQLFQLKEKDTSTKLETLFKTNLYVLAISLAVTSNFDSSTINDIYRKYGDHLYNKGDFDGAMTQYIRTIGYLEPSYVIRKFLDAQRIHNLTSYLQALHNKGLANADHTTLLLNCYTKLKDVKQLDEFIKKDKPSELNFDVETAIKVCRQAGYHEHALYLAKKNQEHEWYLKIQLEDINNYTDALEYIGHLSLFEAETSMKTYGKILVNNVPEQATNMLKRLCTDWQPSKTAEKEKDSGKTITSEEQNEPLPARAPLKGEPEEFIHIFVNQPEWLTDFLEYMVQQQSTSPVVYNTLLELYLKQGTDNGNMTDQGRQQEAEKKKEKALELLKNPEAHYVVDHAMILAKMYDFKPGLLYLYDRCKLYKEILQYYMDNNEYISILSQCKKHGDKDPSLWVQALSYFAEKDGDCRKEITEILNTISHRNLLPPLQVVQILSRNPNVTLSFVKEYITHRMQNESDAIKEDQRLMRNYQNETEKMRSEIEELKTSAKIFQLTKCSACMALLDLPSVHFMCMHSFHQRCLNDEKECLLCSPDHRNILEIKRSQEQNAQQHDLFYKQLEAADDGFSVISDYFGRNVFTKVVVVSDPNSMGVRNKSIDGKLKSLQDY